MSNVKGVESGACSFSANAYRHTVLFMSEVSKVPTGSSIQTKVTHVEGVKSSSIYTNALYVEGVESSSINSIRTMVEKD